MINLVRLLAFYISIIIFLIIFPIFLSAYYQYTTFASRYVDNVVNLTNESTIIKLNVGGKEYQTTWTTLTRINNTFFTSLLSSGAWKESLDESGRIFVDRNGDLFAYILDYLRTGQFYPPELERHRRLLMDEALFFNYPELLQYESRFIGGTLLI